MVFTRPPGRVERYTQELLHDGPACKISLMKQGRDATPGHVGDVQLEPGSTLLWYVFPERPYEIAGVYDPGGRLLGYYTNMIRPPTLDTGVWRITDLFLDVWQPPDGPPRLLDEEELEAGVAAGTIPEEDAVRVRTEAEAVMRAARQGRWPPAIVRRYGFDAVPSLRFRRDAPGSYYANLIVNRLIAFGIYALGAVSLLSLGFAAFTDAFTPEGSFARAAWLASVIASLVLLLGFALAGRLPATDRWRAEEALSERILFFGTLVAGGAVLLYPDSRLWREALAGVYGALAVFLAIFAVSRSRFDRRVPVLALTGLAVCIVALILLL